MNIFYFGGSSFASQYLIKDLIKKFNIINFSRRKVFGCESHYLNLNSKISNNISKKLNKIKADYIFFFSSYVPFDEKNSNWEDCKNVNVIGLINLLKKIRFKPKKIILASSCSVYGQDIKSKTGESFLMPSSFYALTKFIQENLIRIYCDNNNIKFLCYRIGYVFGDDMDNKRLVKKILIKIKKNKKIKLFNKKKNLNLIHTKDISRIIIASFKNSQGILNLCVPYKTSLGLYYKLIKKTVKKKVILKNFYKYNNFKKDFKKIKIFKFNDAIEEFKNGN